MIFHYLSKLAQNDVFQRILIYSQLELNEQKNVIYLDFMLFTNTCIHDQCLQNIYSNRGKRNKTRKTKQQQKSV
jgi:hypothetical protein